MEADCRSETFKREEGRERKKEGGGKKLGEEEYIMDCGRVLRGGETCGDHTGEEKSCLVKKTNKDVKYHVINKKKRR